MTPTPTETRVARLPIEAVHPDPEQPRRNPTRKGLYDLSADIAVRDIRQPVQVRPHPDRPGEWMIVEGERRWRAARLAQKKEIPALLAPEELSGDPVARWLDQASENHSREPLSYLDWARLFARLREAGTSTKELATRMRTAGLRGWSRPQISNAIRCLEHLPDWALAEIDAGRLTPGHGRALIPAAASPAVWAEIQALVQEYQDDGYSLTTASITAATVMAYRRAHPCLERETEAAEAPLFDVAGCKRCHNHQTVEGERYCLSPVCFERKQGAAAAEEARDRVGMARIRAAAPLEVEADPEPEPEAEPEPQGGVSISGASHEAQNLNTRAEEPQEEPGAPPSQLDEYRAYQARIEAFERSLRGPIVEHIERNPIFATRLALWAAAQHTADRDAAEALGWGSPMDAWRDRRETADLSRLVAREAVERLRAEQLCELARAVTPERGPRPETVPPGYLEHCPRALLDELIEQVPSTPEARAAWDELDDEQARAELHQIHRAGIPLVPDELRRHCGQLWQRAEEALGAPDELASELIAQARRPGQGDLFDEAYAGALLREIRAENPEVDPDYWDAVLDELSAVPPPGREVSHG